MAKNVYSRPACLKISSLQISNVEAKLRKPQNRKLGSELEAQCAHEASLIKGEFQSGSNVGGHVVQTAKKRKLGSGKGPRCACTSLLELSQKHVIPVACAMGKGLLTIPLVK